MNHAFTQMLAELESHQLQVMLAPLNPRGRNYNEGGCKRVVCDQPPRWYRNFCAQHVSSRGVRRGKFDTRIKRANVLALVGRLEAGKATRSKYADEMRAIARKIGVAA